MAKKTYYLEGDQIYLREIRPEDVNDEYYNWINDKDTTQFLESGLYPQSMESIKKYVESASNQKNSVLFAIVLKQSDKHIGNIRLTISDWVHRDAGIGIMIGDKTQRGKGLGTEAITVLADYAFNKLNLNRLSAYIYENNAGSSRAFEKAGFVEEGVRRKAKFCNGSYCGEKIFGLLREDVKG